MKKDKKIIVSLIAAGAIIYLITKFFKKKSNNGININSSFPTVLAFTDPKFIFKQARIDQEKMMLFPNYTWSEIIDYIRNNPNDAETITEFFESCKRQVNAAWLHRQFKIKFDLDLYNWLQKNLKRSDVEYIANFINKLPEVYSAAKPGEYGDKGYIIKPVR